MSNNDNKRNQISFNWWGVSSFCSCCLCILAIFLIVRMISDRQKFSVASEALKQGNTQVALAALTPEVTGVRKYIGC